MSDLHFVPRDRPIYSRIGSKKTISFTVIKALKALVFFFSAQLVNLFKLDLCKSDVSPDGRVEIWKGQ